MGVAPETLGVLVNDAAGDPVRAQSASFDSFVLARGDALWRSAWLLVGDPHLAEDLVQTALGKSYRAWSRVGAAGFEAYVRRVIFTTYLGWRRRRWFWEVPTDRLPDRAGRSEPAPLSDFMIRLERLPPRQRAVIVLRYFEDLTESQTAQVLGCTIGTVKSHTARALTTLRKTDQLDPETRN
jgi:RNA polymerase sigma-70 factor (sigma-E family)